MSGPTSYPGILARRIAQWLSPQQWLLRSVLVAMPLVVLLVDAAHGARTPPLLVVIVLAGGLGSAARPRSLVSVGTLLVLLACWWAGPPVEDAWVLLAAAAVVAFHVAATLAAYGPGRLALDGALVRRWALRAALLLGVALVAFVAQRLETPRDAVVAVGLGILAALAWWAVARLGPVRVGSPPSAGIAERVRTGKRSAARTRASATFRVGR